MGGYYWRRFSMKKFVWIPVLFMALALFFIGCNNSTSPVTPSNQITITFNAANGPNADGSSGTRGNFPDGTTSKKVTIDKGGTVTAPSPDPVLNGYRFDKWTSQRNGGGTALAATTTHDINTTYYAIYAEESLDDFTLVDTWSFTSSDYTLLDSDSVLACAFPADMLTAIEANPTGIVVLNFDATGGDGPNRNGYDVGKLGIYDGDAFDLIAPNPSDFVYSIRAESAWILSLNSAASAGDTFGVFTGASKGDKLVSAYVYAPNEARTPPARPLPPVAPPSQSKNYYDLVQTITVGGSWLAADLIQGKGEITGADFDLVWGHTDGVLRFYLHSDQDRSGWNDLGKIGNDDGTIYVSLGGSGQTAGVPIPGSTTDWVYDVKVSDLIAKLGASFTYIFVNPYNETVVTRCELWVPQAGVEIPDFEITLTDNQGTNYQAMLIDDTVFNGRQILKGDKYEFSFDVLSDVAIPALNVFVVDNSASNGYAWGVLTETETATNIAAGTKTHVTLDLAASDWSSGSSAMAGRVVFNADVPATIQLFNFSVTLDDSESLPVPPPTVPFDGFSDFNYANPSNPDTQRGWGFGGDNGDLDWSLVTGARYLVLKLDGSLASNADGFGGTDLILQGDGNSYGWGQQNLAPNWTSYDFHNTVVYMIFDLESNSAWTAYSGGTKGVILIQGATLSWGVIGAYLVPESNLNVAGLTDETTITGSDGSIIITKDTLSFKGSAAQSLPKFQYLGDFNENGNTWITNGVDGNTSDLTQSDFDSAKYLVLECHTTALNGVGGTQIVLQGDGNSWGWDQTNLTPNWTGLQPTLGGYQTDCTFYFVIDITTLTGWAAVSTGGGVKIVINSGFNTANFSLVAGYITAAALTKPDAYVDIANNGTTYGWFATDVPEGK